MIEYSGRALSLLWRNPVDHIPVIERIALPIADLPAGLRGLTIAHLSDFHVSPHVHPDSVRRAVRMTMAQKPDLIALTGDYIHRHENEAMPCAQALSLLHAPLGVHAVLGNHDCLRQRDRVVSAELQRVGLAPLRNASRRLSHNGEAFYVVGVDDVRFRYADLARALHGVPHDAFKIMLVHEPDFADFAQRKQIALQLSGHSHGGQVRLPGLGALLLPSYGRKYPIGLRRMPDGMWLYTTRGVGVGLPPIRYNCPAEITLLTLQSV